MSEEDHRHEYKTRIITIHHVDCASGMECECGRALSQDEVEEAFGIMLRAAYRLDTLCEGQVPVK